MTQRSWAGFYKCKGRMSVTHFESTVTGRMTAGEESTSFVCSLAGETCIGTETVTGKQGSKTHKLTVRREANGHLNYRAEGGTTTSCPKM